MVLHQVVPSVSGCVWGAGSAPLALPAAHPLHRAGPRAGLLRVSCEDVHLQFGQARCCLRVGVCVGLCSGSFIDKCLLRTERHNSTAPCKESRTELRGE